MTSRVRVDLYDPTGATRLAVLGNARNVQWQEELSKAGTATFEVPLADASTALIADRSIVKFALDDVTVFGCVIAGETATITNDGGRSWLRFESQPGVGDLLDRAVVLPEYGLTRKSSDNRLFGFMSAVRADPTSWYVAADWVAPTGAYQWQADVSNRKGYPPVFATVDKYAQWISAFPGPNAQQPAGRVAYFRDTFTVESEMPVVVYAAADAFLTLYLDGEVVISPDYASTQSWTEAKTFKTTLLPGTHILAARVENSDTKRGPLAFLASVVYLSDTGKPGEAVDTETLSGDVLFAFDSDELNAAARAAIDVVIGKMTGDAPKVHVVGHTDSTGSDAYNLDLSKRRAASVANYILSKRPAAVVTRDGKGETDPVASNATEAGRAKNRRVEITYTRATEPVTTPGDTQTVTVVRRTDSRWKVHYYTPTPGWFRASVLKRLFKEARARGVAGLAAVGIDYDDVNDSSGRLWRDRGEYSFPIGQLSLLEVATQLAEAQMDWQLDADTMTLRAWVRRGEDRSVGADAVTLWVGGNLKAYETSRAAARVTNVISHLSDGAWQETVDDKAVAAVGGRVEVGLQLGSTLTAATARGVALGMLSDSAMPAITITGETAAGSGPQPYADYIVGDTISVPGHRGVGRMKARVIAVSVDASSDVVRAWPELVIDRTAGVGIADQAGNVWSVYGDEFGNLSIELAPAGSKATAVTFADGADNYRLVVTSAQTLALVGIATPGAYTPAQPYVVPTDNPTVLLNVFVSAGQLIAQVVQS